MRTSAATVVIRASPPAEQTLPYTVMLPTALVRRSTVTLRTPAAGRRTRGMPMSGYGEQTHPVIMIG